MMRLLAAVVCSSLSIALAQNAGPGRAQFEARCASCHGADGNGGEFASGIVARLPTRNDVELTALIRSGIPARGMPAISMGDAEMTQLLAHLRMLRAPTRGALAPVRARLQMIDGSTLEGLVLGEGADDMQLRTDDQRVHILRKVGARFRAVTSESDWPSYDGHYSGNRYSTLRHIDKANVSRLAPKWIFPFAETTPLETTPVVVQGIMYVTSANQCYALDAGTGRQIWHFQRPRTRGLVGNAAGGINRGVAVAGDRVFMVTDNAHLLALNRFTGAVAWELEMAQHTQNYSATSAPLTINDMVISGVAGGDAGARGFLAAYDQSTGTELWRFWTAPLPGEPGSETWQGSTIEHPGSATWGTGTYDPDLGLLYWPTGNPGSDMNGDQRIGDNLYSCSVVALDVKTGKLKWYFQFTPHDTWDWDAQQPLVLVDSVWQGQPRKLLLDANRNGFFYVLDRTNGKLLLAKPFVQKLTWAREVGADGRPVLNPGQQPTPEGVRVCPSLIGAANWWSNSFDPATGYFYVQALESCGIFSKRETKWEAGRGFSGGTSRNSSDDRPQKFLRAIDIQTGKTSWEVRQIGPGTTRGGTLGLGTGVLFYCDDSNAFMAVDSSTGKPLWRFQANHFWRASPMTYVFDGKQHVAVASGPNIISFSLPD